MQMGRGGNPMMRPAMNPGMPPGGMPGGMPGGAPPMGGGAPPMGGGGMAMANPAMAKSDLPHLGGGGSDSDKTDGSRPNRVAGVKDTRTAHGAPKGTTHQRGHDKSPIEQALESIQSAKESATDPMGNKEKDSGLYGR